MANAICVDGVDYIIVANTSDQLRALVTRIPEDCVVPGPKFFPVAVVHEAAVTLEDDEL